MKKAEPQHMLPVRANHKHFQKLFFPVTVSTVNPIPKDSLHGNTAVF